MSGQAADFAKVSKRCSSSWRFSYAQKTFVIALP
jgi:hypothetical protein